MKTYLIMLKNNISGKASVIPLYPIYKSQSATWFNKIFNKLHTGDNLNICISKNGEYAKIITGTNEIIFELSLLEINSAFENIHLERDFAYKNSQDLTYGYANNCFSPEWKLSFIDELKQKLKLPNYGLVPNYSL